MKNTKHFLCFLMCFLSCIGFFSLSTFAATTEQTNASDLIMDMGLGWNLGTSLECYTDDNEIYSIEEYETLWGTPAITAELFQTLKKSGIKSVRIPVTYQDHITANYTIDSKWLDHVEEVVQWALDADLYCIINIHHDTGNQGWITADYSTIDTTSNILKTLWQQIALRFQSYDQRLLFEGFNEIINSAHQWDISDANTLNAVNTLNQTFVDTVRATGGANADRFLICNTYAANTTSSILDNFKLPNDSVENRLLAGVHSYYASKNNVDALFNRLKSTLVARNIPVILSEFGKVYINDPAQEENRIDITSSYVKRARELGIACMWWDDGGTPDTANDITNFAILNRTQNEWYFPNLVEKLIEVSNTDKITNPVTDKNISLDYAQTLSNKGYLDTGININSTSKIELTAAITKVDNYGNMLYAYSSSNELLRFRQETSNLAVAYSWYNSNVSALESDMKFTILQDANKTYIDNKLVRTASKIDFDVTNSLKFGSCLMKIYSCKIWNNQQLVLDLVPIIDTEGTVCFVDKVSNTNFYFSELLEAGNTVEEDTPTEEPTPTITETPTEEPTPTITETPTEEPTPTITEIPTEEPTPTIVPSTTPSNEYTYLDYAQNLSNSGFIDTGIQVDSTSKIELKTAVSSTNNYGNLLNAFVNSSATLRFRQEQNKLCIAYGWYNSSVYTLTPEEIITIVQDANRTYINDELVRTATNITYTISDTIKIGSCKSKIYSCKIWNKGQLVLDLIPILDEENNVCFFNKINNTKLYSSASLAAGNIIEEEPTETPTEVPTEEPTEAPEVPLEKDYTLLEYSQNSTNSGYVDTNIALNSKSKVEIKAAFSSLNNYGNLLNAFVNSSATLRFRQEQNKLYVAYGWYNSSVYTLSANETIIITQDANKTYINDKLVRTATNMDYTLTDTLKIGSCMSKIYSCKVWNDDELLMDLIPVLDSNGTACFFDNITEDFFYATEVFDPGPIVEE